MRRTLSFLLALCLCAQFCVFSAAGAETLADSGTYWKELITQDAKLLIKQAEQGGDPFLLVHYSPLCSYSQRLIPVYARYAEANGIPIYAVSDYSTSFAPGGYAYPAVFRYQGDGAELECFPGVREPAEFQTLVTGKPPEPAGDFTITCGVLTAYSGSGPDVVVPEGVVAIGVKCFYNNTSIVTVRLPEQVVAIEPFAFSGCSALKSINLPSSLRSIEDAAFYGCSSLTGPLVIPEGVTALPNSVFSGCIALDGVTLPDSLTIVGPSAFRFCKSLNELQLGQGLQFVDPDAFYFCISLTELTFPATLRALNANIFDWTTSLHTLRFEGPRPQMATGENGPLHDVKAAILYPQSDPSWGTPESLKTQYPSPNWGGKPGYRLPVPARSEIDDGTLADWAAPEVAEAAALELTDSILSAYNQPITRLEFCRMAMALVGKCTGASSPVLAEPVPEGTFTDVSNHDALGAYALGLVTGKGEGIFDPNGSITREEAAAMLTRTARYLEAPLDGQPLPFTDRSACSDWALESIDLVSTLKSPVGGKAVMGTTTGGAFSPKATYSRQEATCSFLRLYQLIAAT